MKKLRALRLIVLAVSTAFAETPSSAPDAKLSPAERSIAQANRLIDKKPKNFEAYNALALALSRRARETSDVYYYALAEESLKKSFAVAPDNFDGARIHVWLLLGKHEFGMALDEGKKLNKRMPDDVMTYGFLTDANVELGNYVDAEKAAQMMLDLRPGNLPALTRAAYLRELFGDAEGALELMNMALESTPPSEVEDAAWILSQMGHLQIAMGKPVEAEKSLQKALTLFPGYHYALGNLAKVRIQQKRYDEAIDLLKQRCQAAPHAENLFDLAGALQLGGRTEDAQRAFAEFEKKSLMESNRADNSNRELIFYYADYAHEPVKALEVATREFSRRHDVYTLDAYAWALHLNGQDREARRQIEAALAVGVHDTKLILHAGEIALAAGDPVAAKDYLHRAAESNTADSERAKIVLARISPAGGQQ
jgi:tetratricopeptide (TPR) repeat protein